jgi:hypothetical protein
LSLEELLPVYQQLKSLLFLVLLFTLAYSVVNLVLELKVFELLVDLALNLGIWLLPVRSALLVQIVAQVPRVSYPAKAR